MRVTPVLAFVAVFALGGCIFDSLSSSTRLTETVYSLNDETRWGRVDLASQRVAPAYRPMFIESHREWGHDVQIADTDPTNVVIADGEDSATATITVSWYDERTMNLYSSVVAQHFVRIDSEYYLDEERVVAGEERLLTFPEMTVEEDPPTSAGGEDADDGPIAAR